MKAYLDVMAPCPIPGLGGISPSVTAQVYALRPSERPGLTVIERGQALGDQVIVLVDVLDHSLLTGVELLDIDVFNDVNRVRNFDNDLDRPPTGPERAALARSGRNQNAATLRAALVGLI